MKLGIGNENRKQAPSPAVQALSDDELMDVTGGLVYWRWCYDTRGNKHKEYGAKCGSKMDWCGPDQELSKMLATSWGKSTRVVKYKD